MQLLVIIAAYILGSIPTAYLLGKYTRNIDIRTQGSGNVGTMNTRLVLGWMPAILVLLIDVLKGAGAVYLARWSGSDIMLAAFMAVLGHIYPVWLQFKGGKGLATALGSLAAAGQLPVALPFVIVFFISYPLLKHGDKAALLGTVAAGVFSIYSGTDLFLLLLLFVICIRHLTVITKNASSVSFPTSIPPNN